MAMAVLEKSPRFAETADWLDADGRLKLQPAHVYQSVPPQDLCAFCVEQGRYCIPTIELIQWLKERIGDRNAIEVGAGNADLGYHLGIKQTDSYVQQSHQAVNLLMTLTRQEPTRPKPDVLRLDAESAARGLRPDVVVASWLTRKFIRGVDIEGKAQASIYGPEEEKILKACAEYIHIGNLEVHGQKTLLQLPHETFYFPWLVSRAFNPALNVIHVWKNPYYPEGRRTQRVISKLQSERR